MLLRRHLSKISVRRKSLSKCTSVLTFKNVEMVSYVSCSLSHYKTDSDVSIYTIRWNELISLEVYLHWPDDFSTKHIQCLCGYYRDKFSHPLCSHLTVATSCCLVIYSIRDELGKKWEIHRWVCPSHCNWSLNCSFQCPASLPLSLITITENS